MNFDSVPEAPNPSQAAAAMVEFFSPDEVAEAPTMKTLVIDAIIGVGLPTMAIALMAERQKMADFCGNQHNEAWRWRRPMLEAWTLEALQSLYINLKVAQHAG